MSLAPVPSQPRKSGHDRSCSNQGSNSRYGESADADKDAQRAADDAAGGDAVRGALGRLGFLGMREFPGACVIGKKNRYIGARKSRRDDGIDRSLCVIAGGVNAENGCVFAAHMYLTMIVHLIDGTYELFRHFYGLRRFTKGNDRPFGAVVGVLNGVLQMIEEGATHLGVATDHVIESFRNQLWSGYKTGDGIEAALRAQFHPLERALEAMGVSVWAMIELEADDALASAAAIAAGDPRVQKVCIWTPDKDLAQCVRASRVVQVDRKSKSIRDAEGVRAKFGVSPELIPDYLALVGDSADGFPGMSGIGPKGAASLLLRYGRIEEFPPEVLGERRELALLFKKLATLRTDAPLFTEVDTLKWLGPSSGFKDFCERVEEPRLCARAEKAAAGQRRP
jgi:5'-3' exonuclease